jgi:RNA polymerase-binding transcription factor DksA
MATTKQKKVKTTKNASADAASKPQIKRLTPVRNPGKKKPINERNPNRVAPHIVRKVDVVKPSETPEEQQTQISSSQSIALARQIALRNKNTNLCDVKKAAQIEIVLPSKPKSRKDGRNTVKFAAADLKEFRKRLLAERKKIQEFVRDVKGNGFSETDDHEADGGDGTNQTLRLQGLAQVGNYNRQIQQIDEALHRIEDGSYGICNICGQLIRKPRLLEYPFILTCIECQSKVESDGVQRNQYTTAIRDDGEGE